MDEKVKAARDLLLRRLMSAEIAVWQALESARQLHAERGEYGRV
jgi:hypothetical protein